MGGSGGGEAVNVLQAVREFDSSFWMYAAFGTLLYGAMVRPSTRFASGVPCCALPALTRTPKKLQVPFWFIGSSFIQEKWGLTVGASDALMVLPEGVMVLTALPLGIGLDKYAPSNI